MAILRSGIRDNEKFELIRLLHAGEHSEAQLCAHFQIAPETLAGLVKEARETYKSGKYNPAKHMGIDNAPRVTLEESEPDELNEVQLDVESSDISAYDVSKMIDESEAKVSPDGEAADGEIPDFVKEYAAETGQDSPQSQEINDED